MVSWPIFITDLIVTRAGSAVIAELVFCTKITRETVHWLVDYLLEPILFIIYINDLVEHVNYGSDLYLYADDADDFFY